ncbi:MAG TPA: hypothetical protein VNN62_10305 [Methylomirabilota bacterium]|jgi:hypothetical protein|nr:hypothetical protein [Methylomirabilota bacterium]
MEIGVLLASLAVVLITSLLISALGTGTFFSLLSVSVIVGVILFSTGPSLSELKRRLVGRS